MLTDQLIRGAIRRARANKKIVALRDAGGVAGLEVRVSYGGSASFAYVYRRAGEKSPRRLYLGEYSSQYGLSEARKDAKIAQGQRAQGNDPISSREVRQAELKAAETALAAEALEQQRQLSVTSVSDLFLASRDGPWTKRYRQILNLHILPEFGSRKVSSIMRADIQRIVDRLNAEGHNVQARRVYEVARAMLRWAAGRDYISTEPWRGVDLPAKNDPRTRVLTATELRWLWAQCETWLITNPNLARIVRLELLLGQRSGEVCGICRSELSEGNLTWTIPPERCKNGVRHTVPLPPLARQIISEALADANKEPDGDEERPDQIFVGARGKPARADDVAHDIAEQIAAFNKYRAAKEQIAPFTPHDLRRTVATALERMGIPITIISALLNHISTKASSVTSAHYTHADLSMEIRAALTRWQATLDHVIAGHDPFATSVEDIEALERRMLAKGYGGRKHLHVVQKASG